VVMWQTTGIEEVNDVIGLMRSAMDLFFMGDHPAVATDAGRSDLLCIVTGKD
jgi:hypothetical protein